MDRQNRKKSNLKVCFVGLGSIAKRHIRNLSKICSEGNIILTEKGLKWIPRRYLL